MANLKTNRTKMIRVDREFADYAAETARKNNISVTLATYYIAKDLRERKRKPITFSLL